MDELHAKAVKTATRFLARKGYEILDTGWESPLGTRADIVADDCGTIRFVDVTAAARPDDGFPDEHIGRRAWEALAASWLAENARGVDADVRFDHCSVIAVGEGGSFLRYHSNVLAKG